MSELANAFVRLRPDFTGFKTQVVEDSRKAMAGLGEAAAKSEDQVKQAARGNIVETIQQQHALQSLLTEYRDVAKNAEKGSEVQRTANRLAADSARQLGVEYKEVGKNVSLFGRNSSNARSESDKLARGAVAGTGALRGMGRSLAFASGAFVGAAGFVTAVKDSIGAAGDLQDQMARVDEVFGKAAEPVKQWSQKSVQQLGMTQAAALSAANTFGTLFQNLGEAPAKAGAMSAQMVQLAANMAAFRKVKPEVALAALESALMGRTRSLRQFGIVIDNTTIKGEALSLGLMKGSVNMAALKDAELKVSIAQTQLNEAVAKHGANSVQAASATLGLHDAEAKLQKVESGATGTLTAQEKALATRALLFKETKNQQDAFAKSQGEAGIQEQKFHAALTQLEAVIGTALLPTFQHYTTELANWLSKASDSKRLQDDLKTGAHDLGVGVGIASTIIKDAWHILKDFTNAVGGAKDAVILFVAAFAANKLKGAIIDVVQLGLKFGLLGTKVTEAGGATSATFAGMRAESVITGAVMKEALITTGIGLVIVAVGVLAGYVLTHWTKVKKYTEELGHAMVGTFEATWEIIKGGAEVLAGTVTTYLTAPFRALLEAASAVSGLLDKVGIHIGGATRSALHTLDSFTTNWISDGTKKIEKGANEMGGAWSKAFTSQVSGGLTNAEAQLQKFATDAGNVVASLTGAASAGEVVRPQNKGTQAGIVQAANSLGVGSGGVYATGGGHGGIAKPGTKLDCSGYVYQVYTQNGFTDFPGNSESQWSTMRGGNWVSEVIPWSKVQAGDVIFMVGKGYTPPGHVGIIVSGSGMSAMMMQYYETGAQANSIPLSSVGDLIGAKRFYLLKQAAAGGGGSSGTGGGSVPPPATTATPPATTALTTGATSKVKGLTASAVATMKQALATLGDKAAGIAPSSLRAQVEEQIRLLTDAIHKGLGPTEAAALRADVAALRASISSDLSVGKAVATIKGNLADLKKSIVKLPPAMRAEVAPEMAKLKKELADVTDPTKLAEAKRAYKTLSEEIRQDLQIERSVDGMRNSLGLMKREVTALPPSLRNLIAPQMATLRADLSRVVDPAQLTAAKNAFKLLQAELKTDISNMKATVASSKTAFDQVWTDVANSSTTIFDRLVQAHIASMQVKLQDATLALDKQLQQTNDALDAANKKLTPAEAQLKALHDARTGEDQATTIARATLGQVTAQDKLKLATLASANAQAAYNDAAAKGPLQAADVAQKLADAQVRVEKATADAARAQQAYNDAVAAGPKTNETAADYSARVESLRAAAAVAQQSVTDATNAVNNVPAAAETAQDWKNRLATLQQNAADAVQAVADAQQGIQDAQTTLDDANYSKQEAALQDQATAERAALDAQTQTQKQAAQDKRDADVKALEDTEHAEEQSYSDRAANQKAFFTTFLQDQQTQLEAGKTTWSATNQAILDNLHKTFTDNSDWSQGGLDAGSALLGGLATAFTNAAPILQGYQNAVEALDKVTAATPGGAKDATAAALKALATAIEKNTNAVKDNTKKGGAAGSTLVQVTATGGATIAADVNRVARDALR